MRLALGQSKHVHRDSHQQQLQWAKLDHVYVWRCSSQLSLPNAVVEKRGFKFISFKFSIRLLLILLRFFMQLPKDWSTIFAVYDDSIKWKNPFNHINDPQLEMMI